MAFKPDQGAEPIPGYKLLVKLGSGGFGEVWKASAPGELLKAIKVVYGNMEDQRAEQELKALRRVKEVRHPFLLSLERIEVQDGQLIIVTELADGSLLDRYLDCRRTGLAGIPRDELLGYLKDAAEALDYMGSARDLQHLDVKPQNLLLVAERIKVADFGLVKDLAVSTVSAAGGATPAYASPEAFDGRASRASDQYSLAIVYQEMLTGTRPFHGESTLQLAMQHVHGRPLLNPLPLADRPIIAKALSKLPEDRYTSCCEMVDALGKAQEITAGDATTATPLGTSSPLAPQKSLSPSGKSKHALPPHSAFSWPLPADNPLDTPPSIRPSAIGLLPVSVENLSLLVSTVIRQGVHAAAPEADALVADTIADQSGPQSAMIRPTLYIGLGGLAATALRRFKRRLAARFGPPICYPFFPMLIVDVDGVALRRSMRGDAREAMIPSETLLTPLHPPEHYREQARELLKWIDRRWLYGIPRSRRTNGLRPLGRLAFIDNAAAIQQRLRTALADVTNSAMLATAKARGLHIRAEAPRIVIVAAITGGTGGGMLADMAYLVRQVAEDLSVSAEAVCGLLLHATGQNPSEREMAQINSAATLSELRYYSQKDSFYLGDAAHGLRPCGPGRRPFDDCYLLNLGDRLDRTSTEAAADRAADYLALDAANHGGPALEHFRRQSRETEGFALRVFGLQRIGTARELLAERATAALCRQVVGLWTGGLTIEETAALDLQAEKLAVSIGLDLASLLSRFEAAASAYSGGDLLAPVEPGLVPSLSEFDPRATSVTSPGATHQILARLDEYLAGSHEQDDAARDSLAKALRGHIRREVSSACQSVADWLRQLVDSPGTRIAAADRAADWFYHFIDKQLATTNERLNAVRAQREQLKSRHLGDSGSTRLLGGLLGRSRKWEIKDGGPNPLANYCRVRLEEFLLDHAINVFANIGQIISHLRQELAGCRQEVKALGSAVINFSKAPSLDELATHPGLTWLVPGNLPNLMVAEQALLAKMAPTCAKQVDRLVQQEILDPFGGLWAVASRIFSPTGGHGTAIESLQRAIETRARRVASRFLENADSATLLRKSSGSEEGAWEALSQQITAACPAAASPEHLQLQLVALPVNEAGDALRNRALCMSNSGNLQVVASDGDIVVCHEVAGVPPTASLIGLPEDNVDWGPLAARVCTRTDVDWAGVSCSST
jgi:serine/threonine protein kinase